MNTIKVKRHTRKTKRGVAVVKAHGRNCKTKKVKRHALRFTENRNLPEGVSGYATSLNGVRIDQKNMKGGITGKKRPSGLTSGKQRAKAARKRANAKKSGKWGWDENSKYSYTTHKK